jgi:hypothetical protein
MRRHDQIDALLAKHFAWSFARAADRFDPEPRIRDARAARAATPVAAGVSDESPALAAVDEAAAQRAHAQARKACAPLGAAIAAAWSLQDAEASARATKRLLSRAERLGFAIVGLDEPQELSVRLARLLVRHRESLSKRQRERAAQVAMLLPLDGTEVGELLLEVAVAGDRVMADALRADDEWKPTLGDERALAARLADVVDSAATMDSRVVAIETLTLLDPSARTAAAAALRRALRLPSVAVRGRALHALATAVPCAVMEADLVELLRDLVVHPPPDPLADDEHEENERLLAEGVLAALSRVQPDEVEEILLDLIDADHDAMWIDAAWATEALALAYPETGAIMVDHWLKCAASHQRVRALGALARLPDDLAEPRLVRAASDPSFSVRDPARRCWLERFPRACPATVADLPGAGLLPGSPSDRFLSRLTVMQGRVREASCMMARALLEEAPDREALVLILQLVGDDVESQEPRLVTPGPDDAWAPVLVRRFGAAAVEGLCALAARFPEPETFGWMRRLGDLVERGVIARQDAGPVRELAAAHVTSPEAGRVDDALRVLALLGAPPALRDRIVALALEDDPGSAQARALLVSWPDRAIDARFASELALALADRDWPRVAKAASVGLGRGGEGAAVIATRVLEVAEAEEDAIDAAVECARQLRARGTLGDAWALDALGRPESPLFSIAARAWWRSPVVRGRLEAALGSTARCSLSAVDAAVALLQGDPPLSPRDRRLPDLLARATPPARAELLFAMCVQGAPLGVVGPYLEAMLVSSDPTVTTPLTGVASCLRSPRARALLRRVLPKVVDSELAADIEEALGASESYWVEG